MEEDIGDAVVQEETAVGIGTETGTHAAALSPTVPAPAREDVVILEPGDEKAKNIVRAIAHQNAGEVLQLLSREGPLGLSDVAERLGLSLNVVKYHISNLVEAGLVEVGNTRYSVKGRVVKIYQVRNQVFIVAPRHGGPRGSSGIRSVLLKYCAALGVFVFAFAITLTQPFISIPSFPLRLAGSVPPGSSAAASAGSAVAAALIIAAGICLMALMGWEILAGRKTSG